MLLQRTLHFFPPSQAGQRRADRIVVNEGVSLAPYAYGLRDVVNLDGEMEAAGDHASDFLCRRMVGVHVCLPGGNTPNKATKSPIHRSRSINVRLSGFGCDDEMRMTPYPRAVA
jgi:hypothetical protein